MERLYGYFRSAVFLFPIFAGVVAYSNYATPPWGPVVGNAFGCFAVSIGVQQFFAFLSDWRNPKQYIFLYSSLTLFLFGIGVVLACVSNMSQLKLSGWTQHVLLGTSIFLIYVGLIPLLRFGALYFYRGSSGILSGNLQTVFDRPRDVRIEMLHFSYCLGLGCWAGFSLLPQDPSGTLESIEIPTYFPIDSFVKIALFGGFSMTAFLLCSYFLWKSRRIKRGEDGLEGTRFIVAMGILFFIPIFVQLIALLHIPGMDWLPATAALVFGVLLLLLEACIFAVFERGVKQSAEGALSAVAVDVKSLKRVLLATFGVCIFLCYVIFHNPDLLTIIPFGFFTLGFLTLACAYLPIDDLQRLKAQQAKQT